ncbi:MAG: M20/M25/M40 family metallo-hydrolase [Anaerolineae bacterium]|nr:M20/M25/M40 family metallo-hydrolase [Anaerolineae bacterium]
MIDIKEIIKKLCSAKGPPGCEDPVAGVVREIWEPLVDALERGHMGDVVGVKRGAGAEPRRKIMLAGHMDEISLTVRKVEDGFIRLESLDGMDQRILPGQFVTVFGKRPLSGYIGSVPPHLLGGKDGQYPAIKDLVVDVGLPAEEVAEWVGPGDVVTFDAPLLELGENRLAAKALDDRASIAAITICLDLLKTRSHKWDVLAVATTREEVGSDGARATAFQYRPDLGIALDVTFASQPGTSGVTFDLGEGPTLGVGPSFHPKLYKKIMDAAGRLEMTIHADPAPYPGGTDTAEIQISRAGVPTALISIPVRNMHTPIEVVDTKDIERAGRLLAEFIAGLDDDFLDSIAYSLEPECKEEEDKGGEEGEA